MAPTQLYDMTSVEILYMIEGYWREKKLDLQRMKWLVWHIGALNRQAYHAKKYPSFDKFMGEKKQQKKQTPTDHKNIIIALNKAFGGKVVNSKSPGG
ncbi:MAG: hypothetical protein JL50_02925 [Peptococcaceae bacterium BICA1-7]|nr:MAG: hypothetical protein JL50_02925 [Peptococcaceae bacterium BICA1-7]HBV97782.1 hypothetical protein [Desulfotomaculum sp.]